ncbi:MAG: hypothetical protein ABI297_06805 [Ginsengibacter sp.]
MRKDHGRAMVITSFIIIISFFNFERLAECACIRTIHVVTLLVCGIAIGIFLSNLFAFLKKKKNESNVK